MKLAWIAFSDKGEKLGRSLALRLGGSVTRGGREEALKDWTKARFASEDGLIFIGACGIAVRAIAPYLTGKAADPAVVVLDETGRFCISLLSGHLGGANELAERIAALSGAIPVITTATDRNGVFAVDLWARMQGCVIPEPGRIKTVSSKLLAGEPICILSDWEIRGDPPLRVQYRLKRENELSAGPDEETGQDPDVRLTLRRAASRALQVVPRILVLGVGCRRGTSSEALDRFFDRFLERGGYVPEAVCRICSIDRKADEEGLLSFCREKGLSLTTYTSEDLAAVKGTFTSSSFVKRTVGVDNVCERSAILGSGGRLLLHKTAGDGITMALAMMPFSPDWRWTYE